MTSSLLRPRCSSWVVLALLLTRCGGEDSGTPDEPRAARGLLLVTLDTTRADRLGAYGHDAAQTPTIDGLARRGLTFDSAWTVTPITLPSHVSMFTGQIPATHGVRDNGTFELADSATVLAEVLADAGFATGASVSTYMLHPKFGVAQGFDTYHHVEPAADDARPQSVERPADAVVDDAIDWLRGLATDQPFFLWVHFYDPHLPWTPPADLRRAGRHPYDAELAHCDRELGRLLVTLEELGRVSETWTVVTADHGESLGEHGEKAHGLFLYDTTMRVPLILVPPGGDTPRRVADPVSVVDLPRTLLDVLDLDPQRLADAEGRSLKPLLEGGTLPSTALYLETLFPLHAYRYHPLQGVVQDGHKLIQGRGSELYDLDRDRLEQTDLVDRDPARVAALQARLREFAPVPELRPANSELSELDRQRMAALGYLSETDTAPVDVATLPDPRERIRNQALLDELQGLTRQAARRRGAGEQLDREGSLLRALAAARQRALAVLDAGTGDPTLSGAVGLAELYLEEHAAAARHMEEAVLGVPHSRDVHFNLAVCYRNIGQREWAARQMWKASALQPRSRIERDWLIRHYSQDARYGAAAFCAEQLLQAVDLDAEQRRAAEQTLAQLRQAADQNGQRIESPPGFPAVDFEPEGRRDR